MRAAVRGRVAVIAASCLAAALVLAASDETPPAAPAERPALAPVHEDGAATTAAALDVVRALWLEDGDAASEALKRLEPMTRVLEAPADEPYGSDPIAYSQAMRTTISRTREQLLVPDFEQAFNMFVWTQRSCMGCHATTREAGLEAPPY